MNTYRLTLTLLSCLYSTTMCEQNEPKITRSHDGQNWRIISRGTLTTAGYSITIPGNYMLSESVTSLTTTATVIQINVDDVVLDLGDHTINGGGNTTKGIHINGRKNITIQNGNLNSFAQQPSLHVGASSSNIRINNVTVTNPTAASALQLDAGNVRLQNITLQGNNTTASAINCAAGLNNISLETIHISNFNASGITFGSSCYNIYLKDITIDTCLGTNDGIVFGTSCYDISLEGFRLSNISGNGINIGASCYGATIKQGSCVQCTQSGVLVNTSTSGIYLKNLIITACGYGINVLGTTGGCIENCVVTKSSGTTPFACKLTGSSNFTLENCSFFKTSNSSGAATGLWLSACSAISCKQILSSGHTGTTTAAGFTFDTGCFGCSFKECKASNIQTTAGQQAYGFYANTLLSSSFSECSSTGNQGTTQAHGFYLLNSSSNTFSECVALQNKVTTASATALATGFYSQAGSANSWSACNANGNNAGNTTSTAGYGAIGFYLANEQQSSLFQCKAIGNGACINHSATAAGFYCDATVGLPCSFVQIKECISNNNCTSATTGTTAYGFWDTAVGTTNVFIDCYAASNSDNAAIRVITNYWANLPIGGTVAANFPKVEANLDGLLDLANKPLFYNVSLSS